MRLPDGNPFSAADRMCAELHMMGVDAHPVNNTRAAQEKFRAVEITGSPIQWINVLISLSGDDESSMEYAIPDLRHFPPVDFESKWVSKIILGKIIDVRWQGYDGDTGLTHILNNDKVVRNVIMDTCEIKVKGYPDRGYWLIIQKRWMFNSPLVTNSQWRCYEKIAEYLLGIPIPT